MNIKLLSAGMALSTALLSEVAIHGYLDVMYKQTIPQGIFKKISNKISEDDYKDFQKFTDENNKWVKAQEIETITRINERGFKLQCYILFAEKPSNKFVLFAHGYRADHEGDPINFEKFYHDNGYNFVSVDHTAHGNSEGDFVGFDYYESIDMLQWIEYLVNCFGNDIQIVLHGVSMGGATVCKMAQDVPEQVKAIISDCAYTSAIDEFSHIVNSIGIKNAKPITKIFNGMNKLFAGFDLEQTDVRKSVENSKAPMLFVHGSLDDFVPTKMLYELYALCQAEKVLLIVEGASHAQSIMINTKAYENKINQFTQNYIRS